MLLKVCNKYSSNFVSSFILSKTTLRIERGTGKQQTKYFCLAIAFQVYKTFSQLFLTEKKVIYQATFSV